MDIGREKKMKMRLRVKLEYDCDFEWDNESEAIITRALYENNYMRKVKEELDKVFLTNEVKNGNSSLTHLKHVGEVFKDEPVVRWI